MNFEGSTAVVTGGGTGMGRELVCQLVTAGAHVAMCDVAIDNMAATAELCALGGDQKLTQHVCDVSSEQDVIRFRDEVVEQHGVRHINLLFNNAGIGGGGGFVDGDRSDWERVFAVCWYGVYYNCRAFMDLLVASDEGHIINTSSVNGFWASIGTQTPHTAYAAAKFAVKGFTEALVTDLRLNAPHVKASVVMPGHIGTSIAINSNLVLGKNSPAQMTAEEVDVVRQQMLAAGRPVDNVPDDHIRELIAQRGIAFKESAPTSAAQAASIILAGVQQGHWRILVGDDAHRVDQMVREAPEEAYEASFITKLQQQNVLNVLISGPEALGPDVSGPDVSGPEETAQ